MWHTNMQYFWSTITNVNHVADRLAAWPMQGSLCLENYSYCCKQLHKSLMTCHVLPVL